ncbi:BatD family protein [Photobacterium sp. SDRW27]|uniref:BatD family protein n=1 Tax=Photobacterium obscurum TaxID=2829490 RepID=UPI002243B628|nr:BatD family protein [Photobacterium obscurum]MCW8330201.1 BatD family protein [Photobacterium obscurum]
MDMTNNNHIPRFNAKYSGAQGFWGSLVGLSIMILAMLPSVATAAQAVATVSKNIVAVNEVFQLTITVDDNVNSNALDLSPLEKDFSYGRPSISSGTSMINGVVSRNTEWKIALATKAVGDFTIPSFRIGATTTEPIVISSLKSSNANGQAQSKPEIKLSYDIDKTQLYIGESIHYTVRISIGEQMSQASLVAPSGDGLEVKQIGEDRQAETVLNGRRYIIITRDYQITANKAGTIQLHGAEFKGSVVKGSRGFGSTLRIPVAEQTESLNLEVKGKPASYQGLWLPTQDLQLEQQWQPEGQEIRVGEPLTRAITLRIKNAEQSSLPNLTLKYPDQVRVYDEKPVYSSANGYTIMTIKQVILPRSEGELSLPPLSINWWNTATSQQETSKIDGLKLNVLPGDSTNSPNIPLVSTPNLASDTPVIPTATEVKVVSDAGWWPWLAALFAALWLLTLFLLLRLWLKLRTLQQAPIIPPAGSRAVNVAPLTGMELAAKNRQPIQVQAYYQRWIKESPNHSLQAELHQEIGRMMAAYFSKHPEQWDNKALVKLIRSISQAGANIDKQKSKSASLAPLVPE